MLQMNMVVFQMNMPVVRIWKMNYMNYPPRLEEYLMRKEWSIQRESTTDSPICVSKRLNWTKWITISCLSKYRNRNQSSRRATKISLNFRKQYKFFFEESHNSVQIIMIFNSNILKKLNHFLKNIEYSPKIM